MALTEVRSRLEVSKNSAFAISLGAGVKVDGRAVQIAPGEVAPVPLVVPKGLDQKFRTGTASRFGQLGGEAAKIAGLKLLAASMAGEKIVEVDVKNHAKRPILLTPGAELIRLYNIDPAKFLSGSELKKLVTTEKIRITGEYGTDWRYWHDPQDKNKSIKGIAFTLDPENRFWVPPHDTSKPMELGTEPGLIYDYRRDLAQLLEPVRAKDLLKDDLLCIGQTRSRVHIDKTVEGWIDPTLPVKGNYSHVNAFLIYGGATDWNIRVENNVVDGIPPHEVVIRFAHNKLALAT